MAYPQFSTGLGPSGPGSVGASGTITLSASAQIVCQLRPSRGAVRYYAVIFDGTNVAGASLNVNVQLYQSSSGLWITPASLIFYTFQEPGVIPVPIATVYGITYHGPWDGLGLSISAGATATGTFTGIITAL
jgi:hypothetical protein